MAISDNIRAWQHELDASVMRGKYPNVRTSVIIELEATLDRMEQTQAAVSYDDFAAVMDFIHQRGLFPNNRVTTIFALRAYRLLDPKVANVFMNVWSEPLVERLEAEKQRERQRQNEGDTP